MKRRKTTNKYLDKKKEDRSLTLPNILSLCMRYEICNC